MMTQMVKVIICTVLFCEARCDYFVLDWQWHWSL